MITDIDKHGDERIEPMPNRHDSLLTDSVMAKGTNSTNYITPSTNLSDTAAAKNGQFTIVQVGNFTTASTYVTTAPGAGLFANDTVTIYQAPHGLSFTPAILAYELASNGQYAPMPLTKYQTGSTSQALWYTFYIIVDSTNVYINLISMTYGNASFTFSPGFIFKWYLLYQTSN